jgi:preprotein translocase subunit SecG
VLTGIVVAINVIAGLLLILLVLLHAGRGGGLSDMFGGGLGTNAAASNVMERNLDRLTVVAALLFGFTVIGLALLLD